MRGIVDYYEHPGKDYSKRYAVGQFYWALFPIIPNSSNFSRIGPTFLVNDFDVGDFNPDRERPDTELGTESDELLAVIKYQLRPVIIVAPQESHQWKSFGKQAGDMCLVAPMYTVWDEVSSRYKYDREFIWRAIAYYYNSVFYLEASEEHGVKESIVRFDRVCSLHISWLLRPMAVQLTIETLRLFKQWFQYYVANDLPKVLVDEIVTFRNLLIESDEEAKRFLT